MAGVEPSTVKHTTILGTRIELPSNNNITSAGPITLFNKLGLQGVSEDRKRIIVQSFYDNPSTAETTLSLQSYPAVQTIVKDLLIDLIHKQDPTLSILKDDAMKDSSITITYQKKSNHAIELSVLIPGHLIMPNISVHSISVKANGLTKNGLENSKITHNKGTSINQTAQEQIQNNRLSNKHMEDYVGKHVISSKINDTSAMIEQVQEVQGHDADNAFTISIVENEVDKDADIAVASAVSVMEDEDYMNGRHLNGFSSERLQEYVKKPINEISISDVVVEVNDVVRPTEKDDDILRRIVEIGDTKAKRHMCSLFAPNKKINSLFDSLFDTFLSIHTIKRISTRTPPKNNKSIGKLNSNNKVEAYRYIEDELYNICSGILPLEKLFKDFDAIRINEDQITMLKKTIPYMVSILHAKNRQTLSDMTNMIYILYALFHITQLIDYMLYDAKGTTMSVGPMIERTIGKIKNLSKIDAPMKDLLDTVHIIFGDERPTTPIYSRVLFDAVQLIDEKDTDTISTIISGMDDIVSIVKKTSSGSKDKMIKQFNNVLELQKQLLTVQSTYLLKYLTTLFTHSSQMCSMLLCSYILQQVSTVDELRKAILFFPMAATKNLPDVMVIVDNYHQSIQTMMSDQFNLYQYILELLQKGTSNIPDAIVLKWIMDMDIQRTLANKSSDDLIKELGTSFISKVHHDITDYVSSINIPIKRELLSKLTEIVSSQDRKNDGLYLKLDIIRKALYKNIEGHNEVISEAPVSEASVSEAPVSTEIKKLEDDADIAVASAIPIMIDDVINGLSSEVLESEPVSEQVSEPVSEQVSEPVSEQVSEPVSAPVSEAVSEPVSEPVSAPVSEAISLSNVGIELDNEKDSIKEQPAVNLKQTPTFLKFKKLEDDILIVEPYLASLQRTPDQENNLRELRTLINILQKKEPTQEDINKLSEGYLVSIRSIIGFYIAKSGKYAENELAKEITRLKEERILKKKEANKEAFNFNQSIKNAASGAQAEENARIAQQAQEMEKFAVSLRANEELLEKHIASLKNGTYMQQDMKDILNLIRDKLTKIKNKEPLVQSNKNDLSNLKKSLQEYRKIFSIRNIVKTKYKTIGKAINNLKNAANSDIKSELIKIREILDRNEMTLENKTFLLKVPERTTMSYIRDLPTNAAEEEKAEIKKYTDSIHTNIPIVEEYITSLGDGEVKDAIQSRLEESKGDLLKLNKDELRKLHFQLDLYRTSLHSLNMLRNRYTSIKYHSDAGKEVVLDKLREIGNKDEIELADLNYLSIYANYISKIPANDDISVQRAIVRKGAQEAALEARKKQEANRKRKENEEAEQRRVEANQKRKENEEAEIARKKQEANRKQRENEEAAERRRVEANRKQRENAEAEEAAERRRVEEAEIVRKKQEANQKQRENEEAAERRRVEANRKQRENAEAEQRRVEAENARKKQEANRKQRENEEAAKAVENELKRQAQLAEANQKKRQQEANKREANAKRKKEEANRKQRENAAKLVEEELQREAAREAARLKNEQRATNRMKREEERKQQELRNIAAKEYRSKRKLLPSSVNAVRKNNTRKNTIAPSQNKLKLKQSVNNRSRLATEQQLRLKAMTQRDLNRQKLEEADRERRRQQTTKEANERKKRIQAEHNRLKRLLNAERAQAKAVANVQAKAKANAEAKVKRNAEAKAIANAEAEEERERKRHANNEDRKGREAFEEIRRAKILEAERRDAQNKIAWSAHKERMEQERREKSKLRTQKAIEQFEEELKNAKERKQEQRIRTLQRNLNEMKSQLGGKNHTQRNRRTKNITRRKHS